MTLTDVVKELRKQGNTLNSVKDFLAAEQQRAIDQSRKDLESDREKKGKTTTAGGPSGFVSGLKTGISDATGFGWLKNILGGIFSGATVAALLGQIGKYIGRGLVFAGLIGLWKTFNKNFFDGMFNLINEHLPTSISDWFNKNRGDVTAAMDRSITLGLTGLIFGKKAGIFLALGSLLGSALNYGFKSVFGFDIADNYAGEWTDAQLEKLPFGISDYIDAQGIFEVVGGMIALFIGPKIVKYVITRAIFGAASVGTAALALPAAAKNTIKGGFMSKMGTGATLMKGLGLAAIGTALATAITAYTGEDSFGADIASGIQVASLFAMGGPYGLLIGAIVGTAYAGYNILTRYLNDRKERLEKELNLELAGYVDEFGQAINLEDYSSATKAIGKFVDEANRLEDADARANALEQARLMSEQLQKVSGGKYGGASDIELAGLAAASKSRTERTALEEILAVGATQNIGAFASSSDFLTAQGLNKKAQAKYGKDFSQLTDDEKAQLYSGLSPAGFLISGAPRKALEQLGKDLGVDDADAFAKDVARTIGAEAYRIGGFTDVSQIQKIINEAQYRHTEQLRKERDAMMSFDEPSYETIMKAVDDVGMKKSPPIVMNTTDASTNVSNQQSMVTNNGPVVDISDSMIMRHGAPSAL